MRNGLFGMTETNQQVDKSPYTCFHKHMGIKKMDAQHPPLQLNGKPV